LTAAIWGFAFVAQRAGTEFLGPFVFNGIRFAIGAAWLLPFVIKKKPALPGIGSSASPKGFSKAAIILGIILFIAASLQQIGIGYTTAGKAGFITGLYVILVPTLALFVKKKTGLVTWFSAMIALSGLYFLSITDQFALQKGDLLVLISAIFWALYVLVIDYSVDKWRALNLAFWQFLICSVLSLMAGIIFESFSWDSIYKAALPILYAGLFSVGIGYTLQFVAQKDAHPSHASIIMSLEGVFAVIGGWLILQEYLSTRELIGCFLMLSGMILSQLQFGRISKRN
jgi:drug/metabolite transporter (DMT)-like permease